MTTDLDLEELAAHGAALVAQGASSANVFEFVGYLNVNEVGTHMLAAEQVLDDDAIAKMTKTLAALDVDLDPIGAPAGGLEGGEKVQRALAALFLELSELCSLPADDDEAGELSEETLLLLNYIKHFNPRMRRLSVALTETDDDDIACEYEVTLWDR